MPGPAKCGEIDTLEARFELLDACEGDIEIIQTGFDRFEVSVKASPDYYRSAYAIAHGVKGEDVVDALLGLLLETVPDSKAALLGTFCHGNSAQWAVIRDVAVERLDAEERETNARKYAHLEDVSF